MPPDISYFFSKGVPQDSCLRPFLYLALLETLLRSFLFKYCAIVAYADDILAIIGAHTRAMLEEKGNEVL